MCTGIFGTVWIYVYILNTTDIIAQELDAGFMDAAKPISVDSSVRKCPHCGGTAPIQASF